MAEIALREEESVFSRYDVTRLETGLRFNDPDMSLEAFEEILVFASRLHRASSWWIGDILVAAEDLHGELFAQLEQVTGLAPQSLMNRTSISRRIPLSIRRPLVALSTHAEVAPLKPNEQRHWLARAEKEQLSKMRLRELIRETRTENGAPGEAVVERTENGASDSAPSSQPTPRQALLGSLTTPKDEVLATIRDLRDHAEPLDDRRAAVLRDDLEALEAFLGDE